MRKKFIILALVLNALNFAHAASAQSANTQNLAQIYLNQGLEAVGVELEKQLLQKSFWLNELDGKDLALGFYDGEATIVVTNKTDKSFRVYAYKNGTLTQIFDQKVGVTGLMGDKQVEGDLKTPIGFYDLGRKFKPEDQYYGGLAFATNYPNLLDRVNDKTGGGIWIHGYPLDGQRLDELKTRGCIALHNDILREFATLMDTQKKTYAMTEEKEVVRTDKDEIAAIFAALFAWKDKWRQSDLKAYLEFYDEVEFRRFDKKNFKEFAAMKKAIFDRKEDKTIKFSHISIVPYPNLRGEKRFRVNFYQNYVTKNYKFNGSKTLYIKLVGDKMKILAEQ